MKIAWTKIYPAFRFSRPSSRNMKHYLRDTCWLDFRLLFSLTQPFSWRRGGTPPPPPVLIYTTPETYFILQSSPLLNWQYSPKRLLKESTSKIRISTSPPPKSPFLTLNSPQALSRIWSCIEWAAPEQKLHGLAGPDKVIPMVSIPGSFPTRILATVLCQWV